MKAVSERLGHADVGFTLSTYAHLSEHADRDSARRLSDALDGPTGASR
jgi:integrase